MFLEHDYGECWQTFFPHLVRVTKEKGQARSLEKLKAKGNDETT